MRLDDGTIQCDNCEATVKDNKWAKIKAWDLGWYFFRDTDEAFCPAHRPEWAPRP